jgi:hypothetical protein
MMMFLYVIGKLVVSSRRAAITRSATVGRFFTAISVYTIIIWAIYPLIWALGEGTQRISVNAEIVVYAVVCSRVELTDFSSIFSPRGCLEDGYCLRILGFQRDEFLLLDSGLRDQLLWRELQRKGGGSWMMISAHTV